LEGKRVLDIGCGSGGIDQLLVERHEAGHVVGIDVEASLKEKSSARARDRGLEDRLNFMQIQPGELPFADLKLR